MDFKTLGYFAMCDQCKKYVQSEVIQDYPINGTTCYKLQCHGQEKTVTFSRVDLAGAPIIITDWEE